jgi:hypothetical protein
MAQKLARHSDINLTLNAYTRLHMLELADAVTKLPTIANNAPSLPLAS